jgi:hypothetical protein
MMWSGRAAEKLGLGQIHFVPKCKMHVGIEARRQLLCRLRSTAPQSCTRLVLLSQVYLLDSLSWVGAVRTHCTRMFFRRVDGGCCGCDGQRSVRHAVAKTLGRSKFRLSARTVSCIQHAWDHLLLTRAGRSTGREARAIPIHRPHPVLQRTT